jgi:lipoate-protein ligase A
MRFLDLTLRTPAENLACDEALLNLCEAQGEDEILRVWESPEIFVVVGYANRVSKEVNLPACEAHHVPVFRRCSGGGTVLQGPGCLNYTLILRIAEGGPLRTISSANRFIMERNAAALETVRHSQSAIHVEGHTDLALDGRKFSGNAQRRGKRFLLFHGTFLLNFDLALIGQLLPQPSRQPGYRHDRSHHDFLMNLQLPAASVKQAIRRAWQADSFMGHVPQETITLLVRDKYATRNWNLKF